MTKVFLMVMIVFSDKASVTYHMPTTGLRDCRAQEAWLYANAPEGDNVVKYFIGCSFEERLEDHWS